MEMTCLEIKGKATAYMESGYTDIDLIVSRIRKELDGELDAVLDYGLRELVKLAIRTLRHGSTPEEGSMRHELVKGFGLGSMRFEPISKEWKALRDFNADECFALANSYAVLANTNAIWAVRFEGLAEAVKCRGKGAVVGDLPEDSIRNILSKKVDS